MANKSIRQAAAALALLALTISPLSARAQLPTIEWQASARGVAASGNLAPYFLTSRRHGTLSQPLSLQGRAAIAAPIATDRRFSWGFGLDALADISKGTRYLRYDADTHTTIHHSLHPSRLRLQQIWAGVKYRSLFATLGMKENDRSLFDSPLGSGDIVLSDNARPIPQLRLGFIDFQNIPLTRGWLQIQGELAYGRFCDGDWLRNHFNRLEGFVTTGVWFHYKRLYLRTNPDKPFSLTIGMQHAAQFGGTRRIFHHGEQIGLQKSSLRFRDFVDVFFQKRGGKGATDADRAYYNGNHLGAWDIRATYSPGCGHTFSLTAQCPWEDGSGIGKLNGWDGVWGLEWKAPAAGILSGARIEYFDFSNQSGPIHWAPSDHPGTGINGVATGADDYYNNYFYDGWANYGMALGTPLLKSPIYNLDGTLRFTDNRIRGFQIAAEGAIHPRLTWTAKLAWRRSLGTPFLPRVRRLSATSLMLAASYSLPRVQGLRLSAALAIDAGTLYPASSGLMATLEYSGVLTSKNASR